MDTFLGGDDTDDNNNSTDSLTAGLEDLFGQLEELVNGALDELNVTDLPEELADLFELPNFENFTFDLGNGNCTLCDNQEVALEGDVDGLSCDDWQVVSYLGVHTGSDQCNLLRAAAVQYCGCPVPVENEGKTCEICPQGQEPGNLEALESTIGVTCDDLGSVAAVDGDKTCASVSALTQECNCQPIGSGGGDESTSSTQGESSEATTGSGDASNTGKLQSTISLSLLAGVLALAM